MQNSTTILCKNYNEFNSFLSTQNNPDKLVGYDVETNARAVHSKDHRVIGFSLAFNSNMGCYIPIKALDFELTPEDKQQIENRLSELLSDNQVMVYNCMHEYHVTLNWINLEIPKAEDLYALVKLMMGNADKYAGNGGLKIQSVMNLGYENWSDDLELYFTYIRNIEKYKQELYSLLMTYYEDREEVKKLFTLISHIPESELERKVISYEYVPYKLIGKYGSLDVTVLFDLKDFYLDWIKKENDDLGIDLLQGYKHWMNHHYAGYVLERNGAYWNEKKVQDIEKWCIDGKEKSLRFLIKSPLTQNWIKQSLFDEYLRYLLQEHTYLLSPEYTPLKIHKNKVEVFCNTEEAENLLKRMSLQAKTKKNTPGFIYSLELGNFHTIIKDKLKSIDSDQIFNEFVTNSIRTAIVNKDESALKKMFNPNANDVRLKKYVSDLLYTKDIKLAKMYFSILSLADNPNFDIDLYKDYRNTKTNRIDSYLKSGDKPMNEYRFFKFKSNNTHYEFVDNEDSNFINYVLELSRSDSKAKYRLFCKKLEKVQSKLSDPNLLNLISSCISYSMSSLDEDSMIEAFNYYTFIGCNIEDSKTWNQEFRWLVSFRWFKKYNKMISTYINGKNGRESVWYLPKKSYENGDIFTKRSFKYFSEEGEHLRNNPELLEQYDTVLQTNFQVDIADTGRWTATMHTLPAGKTVKGFITSRFKGGVIAMPDCSQAEVRILATLSQDKNLLNAFRQEGMDIHKYVASLCNQIPIEEVTPVQRKIAKAAVFGILYGEPIESFAKKNCKGDVEQARKIYEYFYNAFPDIKSYVENCHKQYLEHKKVILPLTNRYIDLSKLNDVKDPDKPLRQSQNYPCQGTCCDIAGLILYMICMFIKDESLKSKPFCFIHDSIEIDIHPDETFLMLDKLKPIFNEYPDKEFGVPMASDIVFSCHMGAEIDTVNLEHDEDYNDVWITMKGDKEDIDEVLDTWRDIYDLVEKDENFEEEVKEEYIPMKGLFTPKVTISKDFGTTKQKLKTRYHIIRKMR